MDDQRPAFGVPGGSAQGGNSLLLLSSVFLGGLFALIFGFVAKLWYDERQARHRNEAFAELGPGMARVVGQADGGAGRAAAGE